jgi:mono/diheme cytochrome c family protein
VKPGAEAVAGSVFEKEIQPLLQRSCIDCHGPDKSRGRLRLDSREAVLAGGKSRLPSITTGKPEASELLRRVKLPRDDEDAMPPEDEPGLTAEEIAALEKWIAGGAVWH